MKTIKKDEIRTSTQTSIAQFLGNRWSFFGMLFGAALIFSKGYLDRHLIVAALILFFVDLFITAVTYVSDTHVESYLYRSLTFVGYLADSTALALVISHTGSLSSPFVIGYAYLIANISESGKILEVALYGVLFHITFMIGIYYTHQGWEFYATPGVLTITALFAVYSFRAVYLARKIHQQAVNLEKSKHALEHFAEGLKSSNESLERLSYLDPVTGIYNFRYFRQLLADELERAGRYGTYLSLLIIDIDNFKAYNELFGHQKGDMVLNQLGEIIKTNIRDLDIFARFIGDEFVLVLNDSDSNLAVVIANRIKRAVEEFHFQGEEELPSGNLTVSIGIAVYPENAQTMEDLIKTAEEALFKVKLSRKNRIRVYSNLIGELHDELADSESLVETLQTLLIVVNARDQYTYGHSERVVKYATAIGRRLGLDGEELRVLKYAAFLHDIGKIEINREVLNKRDPLNDEEWELVKQHSLFGVSIIEPIRGLEGIAGIVRSHHERYDGRGYPDGLCGEEIPLGARILAVADSFDAMMSNRPYREALPKAVAIKELLRGKDLQFDSKMVEAFLDVVDDVEQEFDSAVG